MYESFFHLREKPFNLTPSHRFLYLSEGHKEALALLNYGVMERKGFVLLTGDVGTGKTTLIQSLLNTLGTDVEFVHFSNPLLSPGEFMDHLASSTFKRRIRFKSKSDFLFEFEAYLREAQQHQRAFILIIDEAQALSLDVLEEIRLLSNLESSEEKLINIFLVGQPELIEKLRDPRCRALYQRISSRYHLLPLNAEETGHYVSTRLHVAGAGKPEDIFPKRTVDALYRCSEGIPRTINVLADNALLLGYSKGKATITPSMIEASHKDLHLGEEEPPPATEESIPDRVPARAPGFFRRKAVWGLAVAVLLVLGGYLAGYRVSDLRAWFDLERRERVAPLTKPSLEEPAKPPPPPEKRAPAKAAPAEPEAVPPGESEGAVKRPEPKKDTPPAFRPSAEFPKVALPHPLETEGTKNREAAGPAEAVRVVVQEGDYLAKLALKMYGRTDQEVLERILEHNPDLKDIHKLAVGQVILFPSLATSPRDGLYTVHIASYDRREDAQQAFRALTGAGYDAFVVPFHSAETGIRYRITVGGFSAREAAEAYADKLLRGQDVPHARVIQLDVDTQDP